MIRLMVTGGADVDQEELAYLTGQLRRRLLELEVDDVRGVQPDGDVPEGAKPGALVAVGALVVSLAPTVLRPVLHLVETWMQSRPVHTVKVDVGGRLLELGHASPEQQQLLVEAFLAQIRTEPDESPAQGGGEPPAAQE
ncbi:MULTISPECIES: hypothetical protein [unclassified Streptomyces]|uniref:hypothetical protein n=1 Tax=unclassified Streptomyces TaxID=2593676 RepID=UPI00214D09DD|nr:MULTISPECIES: hypothetical protein [unclassified Streptomyces]